jgi:DNA-binding XRE family transcriptional regulator
MNNKLDYIKNNIKSLRVKKGLTQEDVAYLMGISRATYNDYETNPLNVKIDTYNKMADIFDCNLVDFFIDSNVTNSDN